MNNFSTPTANSQGLLVPSPSPSPSQEILQLPISDIIADFETYAYRDQLNQEKVVEYQQLIDDFPPLDVFKIDDSYVLVGGFHRLEAHKQSDRELVTVVVHQGSEANAKMFACKANSTHGLNLTASERKRALTDFIKFSLLEDPLLSNVAIARSFGGTSEKTVRRYRIKLEESGEIDISTQRRGADDRVIGVINIGSVTSADAEVKSDETNERDPKRILIDYRIKQFQEFSKLILEAKIRLGQIQRESDFDLFVPLQEVASRVRSCHRNIEWIYEYYRTLIWRLHREASKHSTNVEFEYVDDEPYEVNDPESEFDRQASRPTEDDLPGQLTITGGNRSND